MWVNNVERARVRDFLWFFCRLVKLYVVGYFNGYADANDTMPSLSLFQKKKKKKKNTNCIHASFERVLAVSLDLDSHGRQIGSRIDIGLHLSGHLVFEFEFSKFIILNPSVIVYCLFFLENNGSKPEGFFRFVLH